MYWASISLNGRTELVEIVQRINSDWNVRNILRHHAMPYAGFIGFEKFVLMHHNVHAHTTYFVEKTKKNWPARSPDLNPIK